MIIKETPPTQVVQYEDLSRFSSSVFVLNLSKDAFQYALDPSEAMKDFSSPTPFICQSHLKWLAATLRGAAEGDVGFGSTTHPKKPVFM